MTFEEFIEFKDNNNFQTFNMIDDGMSNLSFFIFKNQLYSIVFPSRYNSFRFGFRILKTIVNKNGIKLKPELLIVKYGNEYLDKTDIEFTSDFDMYSNELFTKENEKELIDKYF